MSFDAGAISETRDGRCVANVGESASGGSSLLERALVTTGRDSVLRHKFLRKRWQGAIERLQSRDNLHLTDPELWWSRRLRTPLGRALSRLNRADEFRSAREFPHSRLC